MKKPLPTKTESPFDFNEFFFSITNKRGVIRYGNDVFVRVSVYPKEQMLGAPHSLIRHPDMPRSVFKIFWDALNSEQAIGAYVKNLAGNGNYYWVYAFAFPIKDGYLSIRFKPSSPLFEAVQKIYAEVRDFENSGGDLGASENLLLHKIQEQGFKNYEDFMTQATMTELTSRSQQKTANAQTTLLQSHEGKKIAETTNAALERLNDIFEKVRAFQKSNEALVVMIDSLDKEFWKFKFISVNMTITAAKFGTLAASLGVVSKEFSVLSTQIEDSLGSLKKFGEKLVEVIQQCTFRAAALNSQMLMVDFFVKESLAKASSSDNAFSEMVSNQADFSGLFTEYSSKLGNEVELLATKLDELETAVNEVPQLLTGLEVIRQIGAVESARPDEVKQSFIHYLDEMTSFIQVLRKTIAQLSEETDMLRTNAKVIVLAVEAVAGTVDSIFALAANSNNSSESPLSATKLQ